MEIDLEKALEHPLWLSHIREEGISYGTVYSIEGNVDKWEIIYYPIFQNGKTQEYYDEPRALLRNVSKSDFWTKKVPLRYLSRI